MDRSSFGKLTPQNLEQLRLLNSVLLPVVYQNKYYQSLLVNPEYTKLLYEAEVLIGAVSWKLTVDGEGRSNVYIMTFGVLEAYRGYGYGRKLLREVLDWAKANKDKLDLSGVELHVQTSNEEAIGFYKHVGFQVGEELKNYYANINPPDAYLVRMAL